MTDVAETSTTTDPVDALIASLSAEDLIKLKEALGIRKPRAKKVETPELMAARADLARFESENAELIKEYNAFREVVKSHKGSRTILATERYTLDPATGEITSKDGTHVTTFGEEGWQGAMRAASYTTGQIAAVSKAMRAFAAKPAETAS